LFLAIELNQEAGSTVDEMREKGFLINTTCKNALRFAPPLIITEEQVDKMITALDETFLEI